jgi:hypothetical protein
MTTESTCASAWLSLAARIGITAAIVTVGRDTTACQAFTFESALRAEAPITPSSGVWEHFGRDAAVDGSWVAISRTPVQGHAPLPGDVWVWRNVSGDWSIPTQILPPALPQGYTHSRFGEVLAIADTGSSAVLIIGEDAVYNGVMHGAAHVFEWTAQSWTHTATFLPQGLPVTNSFGESVAVSADGNRIAVGDGGQPYNHDGKVYVYDRSSGGSWPAMPTSTVSVTAPAGFPSVRRGFGSSISISGTQMAVGWPEISIDFPIAGHVWIFDWSASGWSQTAQFTEATINDRFGCSVALDGDILVVGAQGYWGAPPQQTIPGSVHAYRRQSGSTWTPISPPTDGLSLGGFGRRVSLDADLVVVGSGAAPWAQVYQTVGSPVGGFTPLEVLGDSPSAGSTNGIVATDGSTVVVTDPFLGGHMGVAYVYERNAQTFGSICDGSTGACACGHSSGLAYQGCRHSGSVGARLHAERTSTGEIRLTTFVGTTGVSAVLFSSLTQGTGVPLGYGKLCLASPFLGRHGVQLSTEYDGEVSWLQPALLPGSLPVNFQVWYRQPAAPAHPTCAGTGSNLSSAVRITP